MADVIDEISCIFSCMQIDCKNVLSNTCNKTDNKKYASKKIRNHKDMDSMEYSSSNLLNEMQGKKLKTEDTGKIFEMAICMAYDIPYDGKYKYSLEAAEKLKPRLNQLLELFPNCCHTARKGSRYDFTAIEDNTLHLSAKSSKRYIGKVAPQVIGQPQPQTFCEIIGIEFVSIPELKKFIQLNILIIIPILVNYTFDCPNVYYNKAKNTIRYITFNSNIEWEKYIFTWTCDWTKWNNSSTLKICIDKKEYALLEIQFHTSSRSNMAIRWFYDNFLIIFKDHLNIIDL